MEKFKEDFKALKQALNVDKDNELCEILDITYSAIDGWKRRKKLPIKYEKYIHDKKTMDEFQRLKYIVDNSGLSIEDFATKIDIQEEQIKDIVNGVKHLTPEIARHINDNYPYNHKWVLYGQGNMYVTTSSDMTGDSKKSNSFNEKKINLYEDELIEAYRRLSHKKREYYYFKIKSDALEEELTDITSL